MNNKIFSAISGESFVAMALIFLWGVFIGAYFLVGFVVLLWVLVSAVTFFFSLKHPSSALLAALFLTIVFERFFTLLPFIAGDLELKIYPIDIVLLGAFIGALLQKMGTKIGFFTKNIQQKDTAWKLPEYLLAFFFLWVVILCGVSFGDAYSNNALAFSALKNYVFYGMVFYLVVALMRTRARLLRLVGFLFASAIVVILFLLIGIVSGGGLWTEYTPLSTDGVRILAFPHAYSLCVAFIVGLGILVLSDRLPEKRAFWLRWLMPIWLIGIIGSLMRHLWIGLALSGIGMLLLLTKSERKRFWRFCVRLLFGVTIVGAIVIYVLLLVPHSTVSSDARLIIRNLSERVVSISDPQDESAHWRSVIWKDAWHAFVAVPFTGIGVGKLLPIQIGDYQDFIEVRSIHNSLYAILVQLGLVGFGLFLLWLGVMAWRALKLIYLRREILIPLAVLAFHLIIFNFQPYLETNLLSLLFWINCAILYTYIRNEKPELIRS